MVAGNIAFLSAVGAAKGEGIGQIRLTIIVYIENLPIGKGICMIGFLCKSKRGIEMLARLRGTPLLKGCHLCGSFPECLSIHRA